MIRITTLIPKRIGYNKNITAPRLNIKTVINIKYIHAIRSTPTAKIIVVMIARTTKTDFDTNLTTYHKK